MRFRATAALAAVLLCAASSGSAQTAFRDRSSITGRETSHAAIGWLKAKGRSGTSWGSGSSVG
jgi:hypothetical protein